MQMTKTYRLYLLRSQKVFIFGAPSAFLCGWLLVTGIVIWQGGLLPKGDDAPPTIFLILFGLVVVCLMWYAVLPYPYRIEVQENGGITFVSLINRRHVTPSEIESIQPDPRSQFGFLVIKYSRGKIRILNQFDNFHEFILYLKTSNPSIKLRGC